jgi:DNA polymerase/3'-5' exonuclease PolX
VSKIPYHQAKQAAAEFLAATKGDFHRIEIAGSIRRRRPYVHDVDVVGIPVIRHDMLGSMLMSQEFPFGEWVTRRADEEAPEGTPETVKFIRCGEKVSPTRKSVRFFWKGIEFDVYIATPENFAIMWLIRTGPAEQNQALAVRAKRQGKKLAFSRGVEQKSTGKILTFDTEKEVLQSLWLPYTFPEFRDGEGWLKLIRSERRVEPGGIWVPGCQGREGEIGRKVRAAMARQQAREATSYRELMAEAKKAREELFGESS